jgi:hypothetical protein
MLDLESICPTVLLARGQYSTVRAAHEDEQKSLQILCGKMTSLGSQVLKKMQPNHDEIPESVADLLTMGRWTLDEIEKTVAKIESLARQKADLRPQAWGK